MVSAVIIGLGLDKLGISVVKPSNSFASKVDRF